MTATPDRAHPLLSAITSLLACHDLPEIPPADPMPLLLEWYRDAQQRGRYDDFNAMTLATATPDGRPSARVVLCKTVEPDPPAIVFYTNYLSRKGHELDANPRAAAVFHWPHAKRQVRVEGTTERVSDAESEAYFDSRPLLSKIGASAGIQSQHLKSRNELIAAAIKIATAAALTGSIARPKHWGGFRMHLDSVELWSAREGRLHDRICWKRPSSGPSTVWTPERLSA